MTARASLKPSSSYSPVGWYVATYIHRFVVLGEDNKRPERKFHIWRNTALIKAEAPDEAYDKAVALAKQGCRPYTNALGQRVRFIYEGIASLVPVYEELGDGSELFWSSEDRNLSTIRRLVRPKHKLEAFEREKPPHRLNPKSKRRRAASEA